ncbi:MAG: DUF438 domain-containing protein [candidate division Zixibacteria bacterium]|nr:DUF438 domain-containing protein [candidate division Zixibacteria bacterium]
MSELINNAEKRRELLKHLILQLHKGEAPEQVKTQLKRVLGQVPYNEVMVVEKELIEEGLPLTEVLKLCDIHSAVLKGDIDQSGAKTAPAGHPVDTFLRENRAIEWELSALERSYEVIRKSSDAPAVTQAVAEIRVNLHKLSDIDKHYRRKENLVFPFLEQHGITGPPTVMWGKHDQIRELLRTAIETFEHATELSVDEARTLVELVFKPAADGIADMIFKEEQILFPMCLDTLTEQEWWQVYSQSLEIGFCLYDPKDEWQPSGVEVTAGEGVSAAGRIQLPSGSMTPTELNAILNTIPFDLTFVDKDDTVRYFTQGRERIFDRNRAILGRQVQLCHPPQSVHIVQRILEDFKSGRETRAPFWINLKGKFIHIEYFALRDKQGNYLGTLEVSQDLTEKRALSGEQRLLSYAKDEKEPVR